MREFINHINMRMDPNSILESAAEKYLELEIVGIIVLHLPIL